MRTSEVRRQHAQDFSLADKRRRLTGARACFEHDFERGRAGKYWTMGYVFNDNALARSEGCPGSRSTIILYRREKRQKTIVKSALDGDFQRTGTGVQQLNVALVGSRDFNGSVENQLQTLFDSIRVARALNADIIDPCHVPQIIDDALLLSVDLEA